MFFTARQQRGCLCFPTTQIHERNHPSSDLELAVMVFALKVGKHYLYKVPYHIYTAHPMKLVWFPKVEIYLHPEGVQLKTTKLTRII